MQAPAKQAKNLGEKLKKSFTESYPLKKKSVTKNPKSSSSQKSSNAKFFSNALLMVSFAVIVLIAGVLFFGQNLNFGVLPLPLSQNNLILKEGIVGQPQYINPVLSLANQIDNDLVSLVYPKLFRWNTKDEFAQELVENLVVSEDGKNYTITIKKDLKWEDNTPITIDDVIFTIEKIQDKELNSPLYSAFSGVSIEKKNDLEVALILQNSYSPFLYSLDFGILPKHLWDKTPSTNFRLSELNIRPVGGGMFSFKSLEKSNSGTIKKIRLKTNPNFFGTVPSITELVFNFYDSEEKLVNDLKTNKIQAATIQTSLPENDKFVINTIQTSRYFAIFMNVQQKLFERKEIREALSLAIDQNYITNEILAGTANPQQGPLPIASKFSTESTGVFDVQRAKNILSENKWQDIDQDGILEKDNQRAEFDLVVIEGVNVEPLSQYVTTQAKEIGIQVNIKVMSLASANKDLISNRSYDAILIGEALNKYPDPYIYWHSSQAKAPGLNLSQYSNVNNDGFLESSRTNTDEKVISSSLFQFQEQIKKDVPAIFLYSPSYMYAVSKDWKTVLPESIGQSYERFSAISEWTLQ
jgi:peptide/nickel transport system substrate-binding protein